jgi:exodeoxyribonuclease-3
MTKIISWNVNGIRSILRKDTFYPMVSEYSPDIICLQEVRALPTQFILNESFMKDYPFQYFNNPTQKKGYSGVLVFSKIEPVNVFYGIGIPEHDQEGRVITLEFPEYFLVNVYVPNGGSRFDYRVKEWDRSFREYLLGIKKKVIICGDFNIAVNPIDIHNPKIKNVAGVTVEERSNFNELLELFVDSFRKKNPKIIKFSWWSAITKARESNRGWRIDYFLVSKDFNFMESDILDQVMGSDHAPCILTF